MATELSNVDQIANEVSGLAAYLDGVADMLDRWANESRTGGWSTHQVDANRKAADDARRRAAEARRALKVAAG